jgi:hypothetical protein
MIDPRKIQNFDFNQKAVKVPEWIINVVCLGYGIYVMSPLWIVLGILACLCTYYGILGRFNKWLDGFVKRRII